jgi:predicted permease
MPRLAAAALDGRTVAMTCAVGAIVMVILGLLPTVVLPRLRATDALRAGHETAGQRAGRVRAALVAGQAGFAFVLLATAGLLTMSLQAVLRQPPGFATNEVVTLRIALPATRYTSRDTVVAFTRDVLDRLRAHAPVSAAGIVSTLPLAGSVGSTLTIQGREDVPVAARPTVGWQWVTSGYFDAMGIELLRGRDVTDADLPRRPHVSLINETLAKQIFAAEDPIGKRIYCGPIPGGGIEDWHEVVGIVADVRHRSLEQEPDARVYDLFGHHWGRTVSLAARTTDSPLQLAGLVRTILNERDRELAIFSIRTTADLVATAVATRRVLLWLVASLAVAAGGLTVVGVYGMAAWMVTSRGRELGIRVALGARGADLHRLVLAQSLRLAVAGLLIGVGGTLALKRLLQAQLFGVSATDPLILAAVAVVLVSAVLAACAAPAMRAGRADPIAVLKCE